MFVLVYTIAYGIPEIKDSKERIKIALSTVGLIGVAVGLFAFIRSFGKIIKTLKSINYFFLFKTDDIILIF